MKRSAAPSQKGLSKKLTKFVTPYRRSDVSTSHKQDDSPLSLNTSSTTQATTASEQRSSTAATSSPLENPELNAISTSSSSLHSNQLPPVHRPPSQKLKFAAPLRQISSNSSTSAPNITKKSYFSVVWCKRSAKKHKNWEGDAVLIVSGRSVSLLDTDGKEIGKAGGYKLTELGSLKEGETLMIGGKEIEVMGLIDEETYLSGKCFGGNSGKSDLSSVVLKVMAKKTSTTGARLFLNQTDASAKSTVRELKPRFDPSASDALVLSRPSSLALPKGTAVVDVVVDPHVSQHLRPHQRDGVNFLYECVMGYKDMAYLGAILADEMGLGKTLQVIALLWTLLKQNPFGHKPVIRRALIVTPGSLVKNWMKEFKKWLGMERLNVFAVSSEKKAEEFKNASIYPVMIVSYEMFVRYCDVIKQTNFDLLICDEGHRLKNSSIKTTSFLQSVGTRRRIVVTGTPIQNDLKEFFALVDFCNPGLLGSQSSFHKVYEDPILKSKQPGCADEEKKVGEERAKELNRITSSFILRRTSDVNEKYLPEKTEYVVFCKPTDEQTRLYRQILSSCQLSSLVTCSGDGSAHLTYINDLKKICNHPCLYSPPQLESRPEAVIPDESGKLRVVCSMLKELHCHNTSKEKITLVSNYTKTLDVLESVCKRESYQYLRLDGQTLVSKRQQLVDNFNSPSSPFTVFLLSSKAGGVGLNLIGANRLVLYDIDWNPANDLQAMARVWRDGQKKPVYIYRLLTTGTIEEKIYQRQVSKQVLGNSVVDSISATEVNFSQDDLKDLFTFHPSTMCDTHDMLVCQCHTNSTQSQAPIRVKTNEKLANLCMSELNSWKHLSAAEIDSHIKDRLVHQAVGDISFIFASQTLTAKETS